VALATITDGKVAWDAPKAVAAALQTWRGRVVITIEPEAETRRERANRFYWAAVVKAISVETGQDKDTVHAHLKTLFNSEVRELVSPTTGETIEQRIAHTTTTLSVEAFHDYVEQCIEWAASFLGLVIDTRDRPARKGAA
jgi:hypothetical protein